jgi:Na+/H+ antiporter NhaC
MPPTWLTLTPPLLVIVTTILFRQIHLSLSIGIIAASLVASHGNMFKAFTLGTTAFWDAINNLDNFYLYSFLFGIGLLVSLLTITGFAISFAQAATHKLRSKHHAEYATIIVSCLLIIDDYLSILTIGCVMGTLIDRFRIAREKLAFLIHAFAGPVVILAPFSSWVAIIIAYMDKAGVTTIWQPDSPIRITADPFFIYLQAIPYTLYSFLIIISVWLIVRYQLSFGPMQSYEQEVLQHPPIEITNNKHARMRYLLLSVSVLIGGIFFGLPYAGGYYLFGGEHTFIESMKYNQHPFLVMLCAVLGAIVVTIVQALYLHRFTAKDIWPVFKNGFNLMITAIGMVFLASILSNLLANQVGTGQYIGSIINHIISLSLLPAIFFVTSLICTVSIGSAWGNFAIMIPIAIPMLTSLYGLPIPIDPQSMPLLLPVLGAIFSGSVCGDQISPLSDTTTMTVTSTQTTIMTHTYTQIVYTIPAIIGAFIGYTLMGLLIDQINPWANIGLSLLVSITVCCIILWFLARKK